MDNYYDGWISLTHAEEILNTNYNPEDQTYDNYFRFSEFAHWLEIAAHKMPFNQRETYDDYLITFLQLLRLSLRLDDYDTSKFRIINSVINAILTLFDTGKTGSARKILWNAYEQMRLEIQRDLRSK